VPEISQISTNTATVRDRYRLDEILDAVARHGIPAVSPWRDQIADFGLANASKQIRDLGLKVSGVCRGGMFPAATNEGLKANFEDNLRAVEAAAELNADCLVLVVGGLPEGSRDLEGARRQVRDGIARLDESARSAGVKLAIEPLHPMYCADRAVVNTMAQALDLCDAIGGSVGVACDVYHVWWDPDLAGQIARAGKERLHAFHLCDWLRDTGDLLLDRGMMGDGVIDIPSIRRQVEELGYSGFMEVEIFSKKNWWRRDIGDVLTTIIERCATVC